MSYVLYFMVQVFSWKHLENLYFRDRKFSIEVHDPKRLVIVDKFVFKFLLLTNAVMLDTDLVFSFLLRYSMKLSFLLSALCMRVATVTSMTMPCFSQVISTTISQMLSETSLPSK